jgi:hypothetical protein
VSDKSVVEDNVHPGMFVSCEAACTDRISIKLVAAELPGFFSIAGVLTGATNYQPAIKCRAKRAKKDCEKVANALSEARGVTRDAVWVCTQKRPNQAHMSALEPMLAVFYGKSPLARVKVDDSAVLCEASADSAVQATSSESEVAGPSDVKCDGDRTGVRGSVGLSEGDTGRKHCPNVDVGGGEEGSIEGKIQHPVNSRSWNDPKITKGEVKHGGASCAERSAHFADDGDAGSDGAGPSGADGTACSLFALVNKMIFLPEDRKMLLTNRKEDGWFNASHMLGAFETRYKLVKAIESAVLVLGVDYDENVEKIPQVATWISQQVAEELSKDAGADADIIGDAFAGKQIEIRVPPPGSHTSLTIQQVMDRIRRVPDGEPNAGWGSACDVIRLVSGHNTEGVSRDKERIFSDLLNNFGHNPDRIVIEKYKFVGTKDGTEVAPLHTLLEIIWECPGKYAKQFKRQCARFVCRYFAGDETLAREIESNRATLTREDREDLIRDIPESGPLEGGNNTGPSSQTNQREPPNEPANLTIECSKHLVLRRRIRATATRLPNFLDVPVPRHLAKVTGVYLAVWGFVTEAGVLWVHGKLGKGLDQPVVVRVDSHRAEKPFTFALVFIAGCDADMCTTVEKTMKDIVERKMGLELLGNSKEEFLMPPAEAEETMAAIASEVTRLHRDVLVLAEDVPVPVDTTLELARVAANAETEREKSRVAAEAEIEQARIAADLRKFEITFGIAHATTDTKVQEVPVDGGVNHGVASKTCEQASLPTP